MDEFLQDVWRGLNATPKYIDSKYFYDAQGDYLFQQIMDCQDYYLTRCEMEIFSRQTTQLGDAILNRFTKFDLIELGAGDCKKSIFLLDYLQKRGADFTYFPIDISENIIANLDQTLPSRVPGLKMQSLNGDYFKMLDKANQLSVQSKVILFLGSSIGNLSLAETQLFLNKLRSYLKPGDVVIIGFDLRKSTSIVLPAYNDSQGFTRQFNLNLLHRINKELGADFDLTRFEHKPTYNEETGACKSYLVSKRKQVVRLGDKGNIYFDRDEAIFTEISQKYTTEQTEDFAHNNNFKPYKHFTDSNGWFIDAFWIAV